jgi:hypothetical protein
MKKQEMMFSRPDGKKHSVRYYAENKEDAAIESIYVRREQLGNPVPKRLQMTLEEVE